MRAGGTTPGRGRFSRLLRGRVPAAWVLPAVCVLAAGAPAAGALATAREARDAPAATLQQGQPRPFKHARHERLACTQCHGTGQQHGAVRVRTARDCAACHHDPRRGYACAACHDPARLPARAVPATMELTVWPEARMRPLPFDHAPHARVVCRSCHVAPVTLAPDAECRSCHLEHHRPEAECAQCHRESDPPAHRRESHLTCAGSACHAPMLRERLTMSRNLCLVCHTEQREHEPGRNCATCHILTRPPVHVPAP